ncbi:MAG TPA: hypothetical protein VFG90_05900 [Nitrososphaeraceae archaeon]|nr:hypothetical protein [Nitrososphaeraceae archaeon]
MKCLKIDSGASSATIRFNLDELRILVQSVDYMADKHEVNLLSLSPDKEERERIAKYIKIKKNLSRILRALL